MTNYTGHPLLDVGLATIVAFANRDGPEQLIEADFEAIADFMAENYTTNPLRSFLTVAFPNSGFTQPAYFDEPEKQQIYAKRVLRAFRSETPLLDNEIDVFTGLPAAAIPFDVKGMLSPGRAFRQHIPLTTGEDVINFHPYGEAGLPVSGLTLLAIQAFPLGSAKCAGRMLAVHSDNPEITQHFAQFFLEGNRRAIGLSRESGSKKMPEPALKHRTLLIETLLKAREMQLESARSDEPFSITAYHLTNSGQGAALAIYHLPSQVILYLKEMLGAGYATSWSQLVQRAWELPKLKRGQSIPLDFTPSRNWLYEDLFRVAEDVTTFASRFIRTYFLRDTLRFAKPDPTDPRGQYSLGREYYLVSWKLTQPFLRRIIHMEAERIEHIRNLGDALAEYIRDQNDKRFFRNFYTLQRYSDLRNILIKANTEQMKRGKKPFVTFDGYISVFEEGNELARVDWRLARDLVLIRMVEKLAGWLGANQDALPERSDESETAEKAELNSID